MHDIKAIPAIQHQPGLGGYIVNRIDKLPGSHLIVDKDVEASVRVVDEMTIINVGRISRERGYNTDHVAMAPQASWIYSSMGLIDP